MRVEEIARLIRRLEQSDVTELEIADATTSLTIRLAPPVEDARAPDPRAPDPRAPDASATEVAPDVPARVLRATAIGRLRLRHPDAAPEPTPGGPRAVASGDIVAFLEAGGCLRPVIAEAEGAIGAPFLAEGSLVGYGTPLFPLL